MQRSSNLKEINEGCIFIPVGSLTDFSNRLQTSQKLLRGVDIARSLQMNGTISAKGCHLHIIMIADEKGQVIAGHVTEGCIIYTTAEMFIDYTDQYTFHPMVDVTTGWKELAVAEQPTVVRTAICLKHCFFLTLRHNQLQHAFFSVIHFTTT